MTKEEVKQWIRSQIDSCIKIQTEYDNDIFELCYNNSYLRALKLSKITGQPVNKNNFKAGDILFVIDMRNKKYYSYMIIDKYLYNNYSIKCSESQQIIKEVFKEYDEYKDYKPW